MGCLVAIILDTGGLSHYFTTPANLLAAGAWQHIALTYDKSSGLATFIHINGTSVMQTNFGNFIPQNELYQHCNWQPDDV